MEDKDLGTRYEIERRARQANDRDMSHTKKRVNSGSSHGTRHNRSRSSQRRRQKPTSKDRKKTILSSNNDTIDGPRNIEVVQGRQ